ncbi:MAG: PEP-CTERM sorting domain-containing protein [Planctomycetota bacterium]
MIRSMVSVSAAVAVSGSVVGASQAQTWPQFMWDGGMKHVLIGFDGQDLSMEIDPASTTLPLPLEMRTFGESYSGNASVLDGSFYSSQFGFLANDTIQLPSGGAIFIEMGDSSDGLRVYEGGRRMMRDTHTYAPIFGTDGSDSVWEWNGQMHHPWFAVDSVGTYEAEFRVFIGDALTGEALPGFGSADATLSWTAVPAPASAVLLGLGGLAAARRRR